FREQKSSRRYAHQTRHHGPMTGRSIASILRHLASMRLLQETPMLPTARKLAFTDVPVVDLAPAWSGDAAARRRLADEIADVCGRVGFFYVKNHGLSD